MASYDRFSIQAQLQHLQSKYQGTGNVNTSKLEWATSIQRDTLASHVGHYSRLAYFAVVENENIKRLRYRFLNQMARPVAYPADPSAERGEGEEQDANGGGRRAPGEEKTEEGDIKAEHQHKGQKAEEEDED
ncbi:splicing factor 3b subunit [Cystoisospora suis]|uniref:Splicing factor 3b subunit n=1 Tax=Cystoisospora suis TaxID=483139 RepID=A0A2C6KAH3_9APIC|nr:splicing factor 3b subunit [Cystoisospora suis]